MITLCFTDLPHGCPVIDDLLVGLMLALAVLAQWAVLGARSFAHERPVREITHLSRVPLLTLGAVVAGCAPRPCADRRRAFCGWSPRPRAEARLAGFAAPGVRAKTR
jgi:hypothetical protein